jgi:hypothetical protein
LVRLWKDHHAPVRSPPPKSLLFGSHFFFSLPTFTTSLDDAPANEMSELLTKARSFFFSWFRQSITPPIASEGTDSHFSCAQTFLNRLVEVIDQAQHFAALGPAGGGGQSGDSALTFREGLEVTERECELSFSRLRISNNKKNKQKTFPTKKKYFCSRRKVQRRPSSGTSLRTD